MLCYETLPSDHKKHIRPLSILGFNVFVMCFKGFEILPGFYQTKQRLFYNLLILFMKNGDPNGIRTRVTGVRGRLVKDFNVFTHLSGPLKTAFYHQKPSKRPSKISFLFQILLR